MCIWSCMIYSVRSCVANGNLSVVHVTHWLIVKLSSLSVSVKWVKQKRNAALLALHLFTRSGIVEHRWWCVNGAEGSWRRRSGADANIDLSAASQDQSRVRASSTNFTPPLFCIVLRRPEISHNAALTRVFSLPKYYLILKEDSFSTVKCVRNPFVSAGKLRRGHREKKPTLNSDFLLVLCCASNSAHLFNVRSNLFKFLKKVFLNNNFTGYLFIKR